MRASRGLKWENKMYKLKRYIEIQSCYATEMSFLPFKEQKRNIVQKYLVQRSVPVFIKSDCFVA